MIPWRLTGTLLWLTTLWMLLWHDLSVANLLGGLVVGGAVLVFARLPRVVRWGEDERPRFRFVPAVRFVVHVVKDLVVANVVVAREIVSRRSRINQGVIAIPLRTDSDVAIMTVVGVINMSPGTVTIDVVGSPPVVYVHVLHTQSIEQVREDTLLLEQHFVEAFGSRAARAQFSGTGER